MLVSEGTREILRKIGLNAYETDAYLALLEGGQMTAMEISREAHVPYSKIYEVLNSLKQKGWQVALMQPRHLKACRNEWTVHRDHDVPFLEYELGDLSTSSGRPVPGLLWLPASCIYRHVGPAKEPVALRSELL